MDFRATLFELGLPLVGLMTVLLLLPILAAMALVSYTGMPPELAILLWQFGYATEAAMVAGLWTRGRIKVAIERVRDAVRDEWFAVGRELQNYSPEEGAA